ncbi:MAG: DUF4434 domain-containing protein [Bacteroidales bacterium]|nr:DUF4434 domain-containing protein [Bacteroidales bacterium]
MRKNLVFIVLLLWTCASAFAQQILPVTGTFINLPYQDVRNKYTNPEGIDMTDPQMWAMKVVEMKEMGMEYLVFMSVANECKAYYPSRLMDWHYPSYRQSPVDAIMDEAAKQGMKVFMSTGWAKDQDDNLRDPKIKARQMEMMDELAGLYGKHPAFYGWYLPVEDCLGPVLTDYAVDAVNALTARARELTPHARIMISPYGIFNSDFDDPRYEQQLSRLEVDIIAYQDEVGCVREKHPLPRLRENWKKLRAIHDRTGVEMWANCESFAWEKGTNDRSSALIPAPFPRLLSQLVAAAEGGAEKIISFVFCGLVEKPGSQYQLGQPYWSEKAYEDYMAWHEGDHTFPWTGCWYYLMESSGLPKEDPSDERWERYGPGTHEVIVTVPEYFIGLNILLLNSHKDRIVPPSKIFCFTSEDGEKWSLAHIKDTPVWDNVNHDTFIDIVCLEWVKECEGAKYLKLAFTAEDQVYLKTDKIVK